MHRDGNTPLLHVQRTIVDIDALAAGVRLPYVVIGLAFLDILLELGDIIARLPLAVKQIPDVHELA